MRAAIHQPNYLPWLGFFDKMARVDVFVYLDSVAFTKGGYQNRTRIKTRASPAWLTVPVTTAGRSGQRTCDVEIDMRSAWARKHIGRIEDAYRGWPGLDRVRASLLVELAKPWGSLADLNITLLERARELLGIRTRTVRASTLATRGSSSELLVSICEAVGADEYLAGEGSRAYMADAVFADAGIAVTYQGFTHPTYRQPHGAFVAGLSVVDALCTEDVAAGRLVGQA